MPDIDYAALRKTAEMLLKEPIALLVVSNDAVDAFVVAWGPVALALLDRLRDVENLAEAEAAYIDGLQSLLVMYRLGKHPSEALLRRLDDSREKRARAFAALRPAEPEPKGDKP